MFNLDDNVGEALPVKAFAVMNNALVTRSCLKNQNTMRNNENVTQLLPTTVAVNRGRGRPGKFSIIMEEILEEEKPYKYKLAFTEVEKNVELENHEHETTENDE
uniref:Uncharacterized protein n=1 Tax=Strongyloides venezuelensis TaxID=75913 RepID=A0A0K0F1W2_STRVS